MRLPNSQLVSPVAFYQGAEGSEFNYCTLFGYTSELIHGKNKPIRKHRCIRPDGSKISIQRLAYENGDYEYLYGIGAPPPPDSLPEDPPIEDPEDPEPPVVNGK